MNISELKERIIKLRKQLKTLEDLRLDKIQEYELEEDWGNKHSSYVIERAISDIEDDIEYTKNEIAEFEQEIEFLQHLDIDYK